MRNQFIFETSPFDTTEANNLIYNSPDQIRWIQEALNQKLGTNLSLDGVMSFRTRRALRDFQQREGLPADSIVTAQTADALGLNKSAGEKEFALHEEVSSWDNPALPAAVRQALRNQNAQMVTRYAAQSIQPTAANALAILKLVCGYYGIPWRIAYTILEHEGGVRLFTHNDGVMQTTQGARNAVIPQIPRSLKLALLGLPLTDATTAEQVLRTRLHREFRQSLPIQIAVGVQELTTNLEKFNGYVALAFQAYNAGAGWAYYTVTGGKMKTKPPQVTSAYWEDMCRIGAALLHQPASELRISNGVWQCDANMPGWFGHVAVFDKQSGVQLIAYKYLRSITERIRQQRPATPCMQATHKQRHPGSGQFVTRQTRAGSLDKLYQPNKLGQAYQQAAQLTPITDDGLPLKIDSGRLVKMPLMSNAVPISVA